MKLSELNRSQPIYCPVHSWLIRCIPWTVVNPCATFNSALRPFFIEIDLLQTRGKYWLQAFICGTVSRILYIKKIWRGRQPDLFAKMPAFVRRVINTKLQSYIKFLAVKCYLVSFPHVPGRYSMTYRPSGTLKFQYSTHATLLQGRIHNCSYCFPNAFPDIWNIPRTLWNLPIGACLNIPVECTCSRTSTTYPEYLNKRTKRWVTSKDDETHHTYDLKYCSSKYTNSKTRTEEQHLTPITSQQNDHVVAALIFYLPSTSSGRLITPIKCHEQL